MSHRPLSLAAILGGIASVNAILSQERLDGVLIASQPAFRNRYINSAGAVLFELLLQMMFGGFRLGEDQQPGGFAIEAVNDEKHFRGVFAFDMLEKSSVKRPALLFVGRDRQQAFRLVDHNDVFVLKNDLDAAAR